MKTSPLALQAFQWAAKLSDQMDEPFQYGLASFTGTVAQLGELLPHPRQNHFTHQEDE